MDCIRHPLLAWLGILVFGVGGPAGAAPAPGRDAGGGGVRFLLASPPSPSDPAFDLPLGRELRRRHAAAEVLGRDGRRVPFRLTVREDGCVDGIACRPAAGDYPLEVRLGAGGAGVAVSESGPVVFSRAVHFQDSEMALTTRGHRLPEMLRLAGNGGFARRIADGWVDLPGRLPADPQAGGATAVKRGRCRFLRWSARFFLERETLVELSVLRSVSAWMALVDGRPVCGWKDDAEGKGLRLPAGRHSLQYFVFLNSGEKPPELRIGLPGKPEREFRQALLPWSRMARFRLVREDGGAPPLDFDLREAEPVHWLETGQTFRIVQARLARSGQAARPETLCLPESGDRALALRSPEGGVCTETWLPCWRRPRSLSCRLYWGECQEVFSSGAPFSAGIVVRISPPPAQELQPHLRIVVRETDRDGRELKRHTLPYEGGRLIRFRRKPDGRTRALDLKALCFGRELALPGDSGLRILTPEDSLQGLRLSGDRLLLGERRVAFRFDPKPTLPPPPDVPAGRSCRICLFKDDYGLQATSALPGSSFRNGRIFGRVARVRRPGSSPGRSEWLSCLRMAEMKPDIGVLNLDFRDIAGIDDFPEYFGKLAFMAQYLLRHGIRPVLVCPPAQAWEDPGLARLRALYVKEFAWRSRLGALDLHAAMLRSGPGSGSGFASRDGVGYLCLSQDRQKLFAECIRRFFDAEGKPPGQDGAAP